MYQEQTQNETQHAVWLIQNNVQTTIKAQDQTAYITIIEKKIMTKNDDEKFRINVSLLIQWFTKIKYFVLPVQYIVHIAKTYIS